MSGFSGSKSSIEYFYLAGVVVLAVGASASYIGKTLQTQAAVILQHLSGDESTPLDIEAVAQIPATYKMPLARYVKPIQASDLTDIAPEALSNDFAELVKQGMDASMKVPAIAAGIQKALSGEEESPPALAAKHELHRMTRKHN